ncbi:hypothetical protein [Sphingobacterium sp. UBA3549]
MSQLERYKTVFEKHFGESFNTVLEFY